MNPAQIHHDDVVEYTLQKGIQYTMDKFGLTYEELKDIVKPFTDELDELNKCTCLNPGSGAKTMCFMPCNYRKNKRF